MKIIKINPENLLVFICVASFDKFCLFDTQEWFATFHPINQLCWPCSTLHVYLLQLLNL